jgi:hypothetical protein
METTKNVAAAQRQALLDFGASGFFETHRDVYYCEANLNILAQAIVLKDLGPYNNLGTWEKAYELVGKQLCKASPPQIEQPRGEEPWPYAWCRPLRSYSDVQNYPAKEYRDLWHDSRAGKPTERQIIFRQLCNTIIDAENARRAKERE